jgi:hypothetical protein
MTDSNPDQPRKGPSPGPWTAAPDGSAGFWIVGADGRNIALVTPVLTNGDHAQDAEADAALMAAAPSLAESLRRVLRMNLAPDEDASPGIEAMLELERAFPHGGMPRPAPRVSAALARIEEAAARIADNPDHDVAVAAALELARRALVDSAP